MSELWLYLDTLGDFHVGTGAGQPGGVDAALLVDEDGLPCLSGSAAGNLLRDACERVALALDNNTPGIWCRWVLWMFGGSPRDETQGPEAARVTCDRALVPDAIREALRDEPGLIAATIGDRSVTAIDAESGTAKPRSLRQFQVGYGGLPLVAKFRIPDVLPDPAGALLAAGALLLRRFGRHRRSGLGSCEARLDRVGDATVWPPRDWMAVLEGEPEEPDFGPSVGAVTSPGPDLAESGARGGGSGWWEIRLKITAMQPLAVQSYQRGNVQECLDFVPGSLLLPAVAPRISADLGPYIASADLVVGDARASTEEFDDVVPVPLVLAYPKAAAAEDDPGVINRLRCEEEAGRQYRGVRPGWAAATSGELRRTDPEFVEITRNVIDDALQRPTSDTGGLFTRLAIRPGTRLTASLRLSDTLKHQLDSAPGGNWWQSLQGRWKLGRAGVHDLGEVLVEVAELERFTAPGTGLAAGEHVLLLCSDVLLRDVTLAARPTAEELVRALSEALGVPVELSDRGAAHGGALVDLATALRRRESWHTRWGMSRATLVGLAAGSCIRVNVAADVDAEVIGGVLAGGIGERTAEGFGQIAVDPAWLLSDRITMSAGQNPTPVVSCDAPVDSARTDRILDDVTERAWRRLLRREVTRQALDETQLHELFPDLPRRPSRSQLGALRRQGSGIVDEDSARRAAAWIRHLRGDADEDEAPGAPSRRLAQWQHERHDGTSEPMLDKVAGLLDDPSLIWDTLSAEEWPAAGTETREQATRKEKAQDLLKWEAVSAWVTAMCRAAQRSSPAAQRSEAVAS